MISTATYANIYTYMLENPNSSSLFFFVKITDRDGTSTYYSDYYEPIGDYDPRRVLDVGPVSYRANLRTGAYSISPLRVTLTNTQEPEANTSNLSFSYGIQAGEIETGICTVYLGYDGITSTADLFPYYQGRITNLEYSMLTFTFDVVDYALIDLPDIPSNKFDSTTYEDIDQSLVGVPIPIVFGRWDWESLGNYYGDLLAVPAYVVQNQLNESTPNIRLKVSDMALDAVTKTYIREDSLNAIGEILDDVTGSLSTGVIDITPSTYDALNILTAEFNLYPIRAEKTLSSSKILNEDYAVDGDFDTYCTMNNGAATGAITTNIDLSYPQNSSMDESELVPQFGVTTGRKSIGIESVQVELSGYASGTPAVGSTGLTVSLKNTNWSFNYDRTAVGALSDVDSFNITDSGATTSGGDLVITYARIWDGSTTAFDLKENSGALTANIQPAAGSYPTMTELAAECERVIQNAAGVLANTYKVSYVKSENKIKVRKTNSGSTNFAIARASSISDELGFNNSSPTYVGGSGAATYTADDYTLLDIPDGDFGLATIVVSYNVASTDTTKMYIKGARLVLTRNYRQYVVPPQTFRARDGARASGVSVRRFGNPRNRRRSVVGENSAYEAAIAEENDTQRSKVLNALAAAQYFVSCDGYPLSATYCKTATEIIWYLLEDYIGATITDTTGLGTAITNEGSREYALYLAERTPAADVFATLAKYSQGVFWVDQLGQYTVFVIKSSYSSGDINFYIYLRDILSPVDQNFKIRRTSISEIADELDFFYAYSHHKGQTEKVISKAVTSTDFELQPIDISTKNINDPTTADTTAEYFSGDGSSVGFWGKPKAIVEFTTARPEYHFAELGDIFFFDSTDWASIGDIFGRSIDGIYFICIGKRYSRNKLTLTLLEVYEIP